MSERIRRRTLLAKTLLVVPVAAYPAVADVPAPAPAPAVPAQPAPGDGPFADVPKGHPAYAVMTYLAEYGFFTGYPDGTFSSGRRVLTRYEFAVAIQRISTELSRKLEAIIPPARVRPAALLCVPGPSMPDRFPELLVSERRLRGMLGWYRGLVTEFQHELGMLGMDISLLERQISRWEKDVPLYVEQAHKGKQAPKPGKA